MPRMGIWDELTVRTENMCEVRREVGTFRINNFRSIEVVSFLFPHTPRAQRNRFYSHLYYSHTEFSQSLDSVISTKTREEGGYIRVPSVGMPTHTFILTSNLESPLPLPITRSNPSNVMDSLPLSMYPPRTVAEIQCSIHLIHWDPTKHPKICTLNQ